MVSERDRILGLIEYLKSLDIEVNFRKNKARGNKGFFKVKSDKFRIDISKELSDAEALRVLVHEFSHYVHYLNDKTLKSLDFLNLKFDEKIEDELISITVDLIPKDSIKPLFEMQKKIKKEINELQSQKINLISRMELNAKQKLLNRVNSRISRMNRYYNSKTELFARSIEMYAFDVDTFKDKAPNTYQYYENFINNNKLMLNFFKYL